MLTHSLAAQRVNNLPATQETWVQSLNLEDSPGGGNGYPLQYSCLENPMDRGDWWATVCGVTRSQTQQKATEHTQVMSLPPPSCLDKCCHTEGLASVSIAGRLDSQWRQLLECPWEVETHGVETSLRSHIYHCGHRVHVLILLAPEWPTPQGTQIIFLLPC